MQLIRALTLSVVLATASFATRFGVEYIGKIVKVSDPQISVDGKSIALIVERANYEDNRNDSDLVLVETGTRAQRLANRRQRRTISGPNQAAQRGQQ
jgi:dipeptidyl aminopeptidase/acylaminoacyl peptidase